jgi:uncharacterized protein YqeY
MSLKERISDDMKSCMRSGDKRRLAAIRLALSAIKQIEVDERIDSLDDTKVLAVLDKMLKQRRESISQYEKAGRNDLVEQEQYEIEVLQPYLPKALDEAEIQQMIDAAIAETGASEMKDMGKVMGILKPKMQGRADMSAVSAQIKARLSS